MLPDNKCWTCNRTRLEADVRACTRPHCDANAVLKRADAARQRGETRPSRHYEPPVYIDPYKGGPIYWVPE